MKGLAGMKTSYPDDVEKGEDYGDDDESSKAAKLKKIAASISKALKDLESCISALEED